jgi:hypothetical protein
MEIEGKRKEERKGGGGNLQAGFGHAQRGFRK